MFFSHHTSAVTAGENVSAQPHTLGGGAYNLAGFVLCSALLIARIVQHAFFRDEAQAWLIVQAAHSVLDLLVLKGEGHPPLYYWILYATSALGNDLWLLKIPTLIFAVGALAVVWFFTPFTPLERLMISLGFFLSWQFGVFSRSYIVGAFFILTYAAFYERWRTHPILGGLILGAASLTHVFFAIVAACLGSLTIFLWLGEGKAHRRIALLTIPLGVCLALAAISVILSIPAPEAVERVAHPQSWEAAKVLELIARPFLEGLTGTTPNPFLLILVFGLLIACFWQRPLVGLMFLAGAGCIAAFQTLIYGTAAWHGGAIYFLFVGVYAIAYSACNQTAARGLLALSMLAGLVTLPRTLTTPYSASQEAAEIITARGLEHANWAAFPDAQATATFAALKRPVFGLQCGCEFTYVEGRRRANLNSTAELSENLAGFLRVHPDSEIFLLVSKAYLKRFHQLVGDRATDQLAETQPAISPIETFVIFRIRGSTNPEH